MPLDPGRIAVPAAAGPVTPRVRAPSFSVVIAAYQVADCIGDAIDSALAQTAPALEVVVCDDGSTDELGTVLAGFGDRIVTVLKDHGGEASAKNAGARAASGEFVVILDADDVFLPGRLGAIAELACLRPDLDIITTDAFLEVEGRIDRRVYTAAWTFATDDQRQAILERNFIFGHVAVRRELLLAAGGFDERITRTTDWECWIRLILDGAIAGAVMEPLAHYRVRRSSLSSQRALMHEGAVQTLERALTHPRLTPAERGTVTATLAGRRRDLARARLTDAVREAGPELRGRADRHQPPLVSEHPSEGRAGGDGPSAGDSDCQASLCRCLDRRWWHSGKCALIKRSSQRAGSNSPVRTLNRNDHRLSHALTPMRRNCSGSVPRAFLPGSVVKPSSKPLARAIRVTRRSRRPSG